MKTNEIDVLLFGPYTEHTLKPFGETGLYLTDKSYYVVLNKSKMKNTKHRITIFPSKT